MYRDNHFLMFLLSRLQALYVAHYSVQRFGLKVPNERRSQMKLFLHIKQPDINIITFWVWLHGLLLQNLRISASKPSYDYPEIDISTWLPTVTRLTRFHCNLFVLSWHTHLSYNESHTSVNLLLGLTLREQTTVGHVTLEMYVAFVNIIAKCSLHYRCVPYRIYWDIFRGVLFSSRRAPKRKTTHENMYIRIVAADSRLL